MRCTRVLRVLGDPIIECVMFRPGSERALQAFLEAIDEGGETRLFSPHASDMDTLKALATGAHRDIHCLLVEGSLTVGYGLLRGWDEGFVIPSLGIAIHPLRRGRGLGNFLMEYLELLARLRGSASVRLRVLRSNTAAIALYATRGYEWQADPSDENLLIGRKHLIVREA